MPDKLAYRFLKGFIYYLANHLIMNQPSYTLRHWFFKKFLKIKIGKDSSINMGCFITGNPDRANIEIGNNTVINRFTYLDGRVSLKIGNNVNISHYTLIHTLSHDPQNPDFVCICKPVLIEDHVWIGARATILPGVTVGEGAVVGAGSVVTKNVAPYSIVAGNPAKVIGQRNKQIKYKSKYFPFFDSDIQ